MRKVVLLSTLALSLTVQGVNTFNVLASNENPLNINFGEQLNKQENEGYKALSGDTYERYEQAKAELPDEVPVMQKIAVDGENVFYVDGNGSDLNDGKSLSAPFKTLERALEAVKALSDKTNGTIIYIRGGEYCISEKTEITAEHCNDTSSLFISAYNGEKVTFTTSGRFGNDKLKKITESSIGFANYARLPYETRQNGYYADYDDIGVSYIASDCNIMSDDSQLTSARYPNTGYDAVKEVVNGGYGSTSVWQPMSERAFNWVDTGEIHVYGKFAYEWEFCDSIVKIDKSTRYLHGTGSLSHKDGPVSKYLKGPGTSMYYYYNIMEELDVPGEWFADNIAKKLYIYPVSDEASYSIFGGSGIFELKNAENVVIDGITVNGAETAVYAENSKNTVIQNCNFENISRRAIDFVNTEKCGIINSKISGSDYDSTLISISEPISERNLLYPRRNFIQNNIILNGKTAVSVGSIGNIVSHNLVKNTANSALSFTGPENIIEYNEFSGTQKLVSDSGGMYTGTNFYIRNNHIRYNYIHDSKYTKKNGRAVYLDDCGDSNFVYGNIIRNYGYGIFIHGGDSNVVEDNTVIDTSYPIGNASDYAMNSISDNQMQNMYFTNMAVFAGYTENGFDKSETWQTRYNTALTDKYNRVTEAKALFASLGTDSEAAKKVTNVTRYKFNHPETAYEDINGYAEVKKCVDVVVDSDCWYINNTVINCGEAEYATVLGRNNVENGNRSLTEDADEYIYDNISYFDSIGVTDVAVKANKPIIHLKNNTVINPSGFSGFSWDKSESASCYKVQIATDNSFDNIVVDYTTDSNEISLYSYKCASADSEVERIKEYTYSDSVTGENDFVTDKQYYAKVIAINNDSSLNSGEIESDICTFALSENNVPDSEWGIIRGNVNGYIQIEGSIPKEKTNKKVSIMIYDNSVGKAELEKNPSAIKQLAQTEADKDGNFSYKFKIDDCDLSSLNTAVKVGDDELAESSFTQSVRSFTEFSLDVSKNKDVRGADIVTAISRVNNKFNSIGEYSVIIAEYAEDNTLKGCKYDKFTANDVNEETTKYEVKANTALIRVYAWSDMIPLINR